jgi:hypothetical protein
MSSTVQTIPSDAARLTLHPKQAAVYRSQARFKVLVAGRRTGKTWYARTRMLAAALQVPGRYWYIAPTRIMAKDIFWSDLKSACDPSWLRRPPMETELRLDLVGGGEIQLHGGEDPDALRGRRLNGVIFDEFADMAVEVWTEAIRPALADTRGWAEFLGTPKAFNHFYDLFLKGQGSKTATDDNRDWASWQFKTIDNPFIPPTEIEAARSDMDPRSFRQEFEASFEAVAGRAYYAFERQQHIGQVTLESSLPVCVTFDFNVNPATAVIGQAFKDECRVWREVFLTHTGGEATRAAVAKVLQLLDGWRGPIRLYGDASGTAAKTTGPSDHAVVMAAFPRASWHVPKANPHVRDRIAAVNTRCLTDDGRVHMRIDPSCTHVIADLEQVIFADNGELDKKSNPLLTHISDALGYWVHQDWPPVVKVAAASAHYGHLI